MEFRLDNYMFYKENKILTITYINTNTKFSLIINLKKQNINNLILFNMY